MTLNNIMENDGANQVGWLSLFIAYCGIVWDWISEHGNETIVIISGILGIIFLFFKIKISRIELKLKQKELKESGEFNKRTEETKNDPE
jgi:hypothetical protein